MKDQARVMKNTILLMAMQLGLNFFQIIMSVILARYLKPQGFGVMAFAMAYVMMYSILPSFGMTSLATRDLARDPDLSSRYLTSGLTGIAFLSTFTLILVMLISLFGFRFPSEKIHVIFWMAILMVLESTFNFAASFFRAQQKMKMVVILHFILYSGWLVTLVTVVFFKGGLDQILATRAVVQVLVTILAVGFINKYLQKLTWKWDPAFTIKMLKRSLPFALFQIFVMVYVKVDMVMISMMKGDIITGWYAASQKFRQMLTFIPQSVLGATLPAMAKFSKDSHTDLIETFNRNCRYLWIISMPVAGFVFIAADQLVMLFYGDAYLPAVLALRILIWTIVFAFPNNLFSGSLSAINLEGKVGQVLAVGAIFNILTNLVAIPYWAHIGAAVTTVLSEALVFVIQALLLQKALPQARPLGHFGRLTIATSVMTGCAALLHRFPIFFSAPISGLVYVGAILILKIIGPEDWKFISAIFLKKRSKANPNSPEPENTDIPAVGDEV